MDPIGDLIRQKKRVTLSDLVVDSASKYWLEVVRFLQETSGSRGEGETIAVVDSGCSADFANLYAIELVEPLDLTGEGPDDHLGHGTKVGLTLALLAPQAKQCPIKIFDAKGSTRLLDEGGQVAMVSKALDHAEKAGATLVNLSWSLLRRFDETPKEYRPRFMCVCPLCRTITAFVERTNIEVFVSEGNFLHYDSEGGRLEKRRQGDWTCPGAASLVVPVFGHTDGKSTYDTNIIPTCGVTAPAELKFQGTPSILQRLFTRGGVGATWGFAGSSFSAPLVAGTYASLRSAFRWHGMDNLTIPRNFEREEPDHYCTDFNFPLDLFFVPPDREFEEAPRADVHNQWFVIHKNATLVAQRFIDAGGPDEAGLLCAFVANLMSIAYRHTTIRSPLNDLLGTLALDTSISGVSLLLQSHLAILAPSQMKLAKAHADLLLKRGGDAELIRGRLAEVEELQRKVYRSLLSGG